MGIGEAKNFISSAADKVANKAADVRKAATGAAKEGVEKTADARKAAANMAVEGANAAAKIGRAAIGAAAEGAKQMKERSQESKLEKKLAGLNPVTREEYQTPGYDRPNIIAIVDEDSRKGEELCEGAIGWLTVLPKNNTEILNMYDEFADESGLVFYPHASIGTVYYYDRLEKGRYIDINRLFEIAQSERATELKQIAHKLGAKHCRLEMRYSEKESSSVKEGIDAGLSPIKGKEIAGVKADESKSSSSERGMKVVFDQTFEGAAPTMPELKWYANNKEILDLIQTRLDGSANTTIEYHIGSESLSISTVSETVAANMDAAIKALKIKAKGSIAKKASKESHQLLDLYIQF